MKLLWICLVVLSLFSFAACADCGIKNAKGKCQKPLGQAKLFEHMKPHNNPGRPVDHLACRSLAISSTKKTIKAGAKVLQSTVDRFTRLVKGGISLGNEINIGGLNKSPRKKLDLTKKMTRYRKAIHRAVSETYNAMQEFAKDYGYEQLNLYTKIANALVKGRV